jgi:hypothetical protein
MYREREREISACFLFEQGIYIVYIFKHGKTLLVLLCLNIQTKSTGFCRVKYIDNDAALQGRRDIQGRGGL